MKVPKSGIAQFFKKNLAVGVAPDVGVGSNCRGEVHWWGMRVKIRPEQYHFFYPNTNTQYFQRGSNNTQYQYQFFEEALTIPNTNTNIHEGS